MMNIKKYPIIVFSILSLLYLFPIIKADRYFIDDYNRSVLGYLSWSDNGRPLADIVMSFLNFNTTISDLSPLTQLLGVGSLIIVLIIIMQQGSLGALQSVACALCVLISPFMMETLSYAYDSFPMLLSIALVYLPFYFKYSNKLFLFSVHTLFVIASLCLYQASISIYVIISIFIYILNNNKDRSGLEVLLINAISFITGYLLYSKVVAKHFISGGYSLNRAEIIDFSKNGAFEHFFSNAIKYIDFLMLGFPLPFMVISVSIVIIGVFGILIRGVELLRQGQAYSYVAAVITITSPLIVSSLVIIPLSVLANPPLMSRVLASTGVVMMFFMFFSFRIKCKPIALVVGVLVSIFMIYSYSSVYAYGNAQKKQKEFEAYTISLMHSDISKSNARTLDIYGSAPTSPISTLIVSQHMVMSWMVLSNITFRDEWRTNITLSNFRFPLKYKKGSFPDGVENPSCELITHRYNGIYTVFEKDDAILFYFKDICNKI